MNGGHRDGPFDCRQPCSAAVESRPFLLAARQAEAQRGGAPLEAAHHDAGAAERIEEARRLRQFDEAEQRRAAGHLDVETGKQRIHPLGIVLQPGAHPALPAMVGQRADTIVQRRAAHRPRAEAARQARGDVLGGEGKAEPDAGQSEELAEGAQHHQTGTTGITRTG